MPPERTSGEALREGGRNMRGYYTAGGYYGRVNGRYMLFSSESDYLDYLCQEEDGPEGRG